MYTLNMPDSPSASPPAVHQLKISSLPPMAAPAELNDLLLRLRLQSLPGGQKDRRGSERSGGSKRIERLIANVSGEFAFLENIMKGLLGENSDT